VRLYFEIRVARPTVVRSENLNDYYGGNENNVFGKSRAFDTLVIGSSATEIVRHFMIIAQTVTRYYYVRISVCTTVEAMFRSKHGRGVSRRGHELYT